MCYALAIFRVRIIESATRIPICAYVERAYNLIMKEKKGLLSFDLKLKFIFSHSALKEGWDNPNVFQICALRDTGSERERRQTIGRGLRFYVNQEGHRLRGFDINMGVGRIRSKSGVR